jgi:hypothetical protein
MYNSIQQLITVHIDKLQELMKGPDVLWQQRMIHALDQLGYDVVLHEFEQPNGKTPMHGFAMQQTYREGKWLLSMPGHICAMKEGVIYDTTDTRFQSVNWAWELKKQTA